MPTRARRLYRMLSNNDFELIMDDEKYFLLQDQLGPTNRGFYTSNKRTTAPQVKFKRIQKFEPKILVWIAILFRNLFSQNRNKLLVKQLI